MSLSVTTKNSLELVSEVGIPECGVGVDTLGREGQYNHEQGQVSTPHEEVFDLVERGHG